MNELSWPYSRSGLAAPATAQQIVAAETALGREFPDDVRAFYAMSDGFNGCLVPGNDATYLRLHVLDEMIAATSGYDIAKSIGPLILIGDNGGDWFYALDYAGRPTTFVGGSFLARARSELEVMGRSLNDFLARIAER